MEEFCKSLPKVELHAHINGSVSEVTIQKLLAKKRNFDQSFSFKKGSTATLKECFEKFRLIHQLTDNAKSVYQVTYDVIHEFHEDNVKYLELRSTPRAVQDTGMSKESYVESVLRAIRDCKDLDIKVRLLLAIDRRNGVQVGWETLKLAQKFQESHRDLIAGIDLSGDPNVGDARDYLPIFREAKKSGLKLALHLCEVPAPEETMDMLNLPPDRIGHGTCLHREAGGNQEFVDTVLKHNTPLELCLTSNLIGQTVPNLDNHQFKFWYEKKHPCIICTDDKGVFSTSLSEEYQLAASTFDLKQCDLWNLSEQSINYAFCEENVKEKLRDKFKVYKSKIEEQFNIKL
ncbi:adenosine deaminase-like protein [Saccostrea echinata]|uniref:adenosine deaminase-like protein n=1 Tax=Saccostrea echinata TaxID=191078 RepID=UPI002A8323B9|nr:adenosine deaminase-like protein [Saccostrea echinata]